MTQTIGLTSVVVEDYDEAIVFFTDVLGFELVQDEYQPQQDKRWVVVAPAGSPGILLARAKNEKERSRIGNQTGGRVFLFLYTDDFWRDYEDYRSKGVEFIREPLEADYGTVSVFKDLYGNLWDLVERKEG